jgi:hypothetical protein
MLQQAPIALLRARHDGIMRGKPCSSRLPRPSRNPACGALASAMVLLTATCFAQGVGPLAVGILNDALKNDLWQ